MLYLLLGFHLFLIRTGSAPVQRNLPISNQVFFDKTECLGNDERAVAWGNDQRFWGKGEITHYIERMEHLISCSLKATKTFIYKHFYNRVTLLKTEQSNVQQTSCWTGNNTVWVWYYFDLMLTLTANMSCQAVSPFMKKSVLNCFQCAFVMYFISQKYVFKKLCLQIKYIAYCWNKRPFKCT